MERSGDGIRERGRGWRKAEEGVSKVEENGGGSRFQGTEETQKLIHWQEHFSGRADPC